MQTWWSRSPYFDVAVYLNDPSHFTAQWVSSVQSYGWGLIPIYSGLQAPCSGDTSTFSSDKTTASAQGTDEGTKAANAAKALGLGGTVIYKDLEQYTAGGTCSTAVVAFLTSWITAVKKGGGFAKAGVYASPFDSGDVNAANADDIWIASQNTEVTVWGQEGNGLPDNEWPNDQRIHQYNGDSLAGGPYYRTWGGTKLHVDVDIEDGDVVPGNPIKTYNSWTVVSVSAGPDTCPQSINDVYLGNSTGNAIGQVVGYTWCSNTYPQQGFLWDNGTVASVNCNDPQGFIATAINNMGEVVGWGYSTGNAYQWPDCTPVTCGGAQTRPTGINDAGWITGSTANGDVFLQKPDGTCLTSKPSNILSTGNLDGIGRLVGVDLKLGSFLADFQGNTTPAITAITDPNAGGAAGINNNGVVSGETPVSPISGGFLLYGGNWYPNGSYTDDLQVYSPGSDGSVPGINDAGQLAGWYISGPCCSGNTYSGFVAVPPF
jgi:Rv2525c-like, glycoside hydrolase-like domain